MIPNDPIEDLFRNEVVNNIPLEKPREMVWKKIAEDLPSKKKAPIKDFIQSVWFAAAVFGLIAIPYFYFFIENLNNQTSTNQVIYDIVNHQLESAPVIDNTKRESFPVIQPTLDELEGEELVKNTSPTKKNTTEIKSYENEPEIIGQSVEDSSPRMNAVMMSAGAISYKTDDSDFNKKDSLTIASSIQSEESNNINLTKLPEDSIQKINQLALVSKDSSRTSIQQQSTKTRIQKNKLRFYRNKLSYTDKVHKVVFELISKSSDQLIFRNGNVDFKLVKENGQILFITNSKEVKQEIINEIALNKEHIFNYYMNTK